MQLENLVVDAIDPGRLGRFWEAALGCERLTDEPAGYETRLTVDGGPVLDLCFQRVEEPAPDPTVLAPRLHPDLASGGDQAATVDRLLRLGARRLDLGQGDVPWVVLADPEGNPFCVGPDRPEDAGTGPIASLPLDSADPARDAGFWSWLTGWSADDADPTTLRHPSGRGPRLALCDELAPKSAAKNRLHLDVRLEPGEDADVVGAAITERGGRQLLPHVTGLAWRIYTDPSGNEFCVLPAPRR